MSNSVSFAYLIDDDPLNNSILTMALLKNGLAKTVLSSTSADNAMKFLEGIEEKNQDLPEVIFVDLSMPGMNGWQFIDRFYTTFGKKVSTDVVVLSSTRSWADLVRTEMMDEVDYFIKKPVTLGELETFFNRKLLKGDKIAISS